MIKPNGAFTLVEHYFQENNGSIGPRSLCWAPSLFLLETLTTLKVEYSRPGDEGDFLLKLVSERENATLFNHSPILHPPIRKDEEFVAVKAKRRPVLILSRPHQEVDSRFRRGGDFPGAYLVAPLYSFESYGEMKYHQEFLERVKAFEYHQFFYLPASEEHSLRESFLRFDRIQAVAKRNLDPMPTMLTEDAWDLFRDWFAYHMTGILDDTLRDYREICLKAITDATEP